MRRLREHPTELTLVAFALAAGTRCRDRRRLRLRAFASAWSHLHPAWIALAAVASVLALVAYGLAYRSIAALDGGPRLSLPLTSRVVAAGFGPFAAGGGFALDKRAFHAIQDGDERDATVRVLGPAPHARARTRGVSALPALARAFASCWQAWAGAALYWALDIASLYGALRFVGFGPGVPETVLAYATGYALTRRSMPLDGAGATEALMTVALHWIGFAVAPALAAVVVYRVFNFVLPTLPAVLARPRVKPLLDAADEGRTPAQRERRRAAAALSPTSR